MNNPLLYPFLAICGVLASAFAVWCYFTIRDWRRAKSDGRAKVRDALRVYERSELELELRSYGTLYRHHGHRHAKRPKNRADRRRGVEWSRILSRAGLERAS